VPVAIGNKSKVVLDSVIHPYRGLTHQLISWS